MYFTVRCVFAGWGVLNAAVFVGMSVVSDLMVRAIDVGDCPFSLLTCYIGSRRRGMT